MNSSQIRTNTSQIYVVGDVCVAVCHLTVHNITTASLLFMTLSGRHRMWPDMKQRLDALPSSVVKSGGAVALLSVRMLLQRWRFVTFYFSEDGRRIAQCLTPPPLTPIPPPI